MWVKANVSFSETDVSTSKLGDGAVVVATEKAPAPSRPPVPGRKFGQLWVMLPSYPWNLPVRKHVEVTDGVTAEGGPIPVETEKLLTEKLLTGKLGVLTGMTIITDGLERPKAPRYSYYLKHNKRGVEITVSDAEQNGHFYIYQYRSAREARAELKAHHVPDAMRRWRKKK